MILVIGNTPQRVLLKDLNDSVYYKQQKVFTDEQYRKSQDLQREVQKGTLSILKKTDEKNGSFDIPAVAFTTTPQDKSSGIDSSKLDTLLERIQSLETAITLKATPAVNSVPVSTDELHDKIQRLERELSGVSSEKTLSVLYEAIRKIEERLDKKSDDGLLDKLEALINRAPVAAAAPVREEIRPEDVYVPSVTVEDANTHIKLHVRTIESSDDLGDSLKKLRELKSKST
jgi:hypothetical protein